MAPAALLPTLAVLGVLVLVWATTTGPVGVMSDSGRRLRFGTDDAPPATPSDAASTGNLRQTTEHVQQRLDLAWLGTLIVTLGYVAIAVAVFLAARYAWRRRWRPPEKPPELDFDVLPDAAVREHLADGLDFQLDAIGSGEPRNAIVACWLRLEEAVTDAGVRPHPAETSTELATRVLHALDVDPRAVGTLVRLFHEARFSEHPLGEDAREEARSALLSLHEDLRARGALR